MSGLRSLTLISGCRGVRFSIIACHGEVNSHLAPDWRLLRLGKPVKYAVPAASQTAIMTTMWKASEKARGRTARFRRSLSFALPVGHRERRPLWPCTSRRRSDRRKPRGFGTRLDSCFRSAGKRRACRERREPTGEYLLTRQPERHHGARCSASIEEISPSARFGCL